MPRSRAALLSMVLAASLVTGCESRQEADNNRTTTTGTGAEDMAVAVDAEGRVVVLDADTGEEVRELFDGVAVADPAKNGIAVTPDRQLVFVVRPTAGGEEAPGEIVQVPVAGGRVTVVAHGRAPAVSPDGRTLAYVALREGDLLPEPLIVLRDLDTGEETSLDRQQPFPFIGEVDWTPDGHNVVFTAGQVHQSLYVVDRSARSLDQARRLGPQARGEGVSWRAVASYGEERLAVAETCCDPPELDRWLVVAVNISAATVEGGLLPADRIEATGLDSDSRSERLLIVVREADGGSRLFRWDGGTAEPRSLADGIVVAAW